MTYQIPTEFYDGMMHRVTFAKGADFTAKWETLRADGFTVAITETAILACKIMEGDPIPPMAA
jgi:hypothetical protein